MRREVVAIGSSIMCFLVLLLSVLSLSEKSNQIDLLSVAVILLTLVVLVSPLRLQRDTSRPEDDRDKAQKASRAKFVARFSARTTERQTGDDTADLSDQ